jgi:hypothetical protein
MFFRSTRCSLNRDRHGNEQQHTPIQEDDAEETETLKRMSGTFFNQWRLRRDRHEYSDDDDGSTSSSGASMEDTKYNQQITRSSFQVVTAEDSSVL